MIKLYNIKNIIFDFGGVILNIKPELVYGSFKNLNFRNFKKSFQKYKETGFFEKFETGEITSEKFRRAVNNELKVFLHDRIIDEAWNNMLLNYPSENIEILQELRKTYRIFLLSNTNQIHYDYYIPAFKNKFGFELNDIFVKTYFSHKIGMRKPGKEIFLKVLNENSLSAKETLFIDDFHENRKTAVDIGLKTTEIKTNEGLSKIFKKS